jgi:hypothetical protein
MYDEDVDPIIDDRFTDFGARVRTKVRWSWKGETDAQHVERSNDFDQKREARVGGLRRRCSDQDLRLRFRLRAHGR